MHFVYFNPLRVTEINFITVTSFVRPTPLFLVARRFPFAHGVPAEIGHKHLPLLVWEINCATYIAEVQALSLLVPKTMFLGDVGVIVIEEHQR